VAASSRRRRSVFAAPRAARPRGAGLGPSASCKPLPLAQRGRGLSCIVQHLRHG
jgi:hypothetical protein